MNEFYSIIMLKRRKKIHAVNKFQGLGFENTFFGYIKCVCNMNTNINQWIKRRKKCF